MAPLRAALLGVAVAGALGDEWASWKARYGKVYNGADDDEVRRQVFEDNLQYINSENAKELSYTLETNMFSDLTADEFSSTYMGFKPAFGNAPVLGEHVPSDAAVPASVDWSTKSQVVTPVKNQKSCGSCWAFSSTGALEGASGLRGNHVSLSEQQFVDCAKSAGNGCEGGDMGSAFAWAQSHGICSEASYAYKGIDEQCRSSCEVALPAHTVTGVKQVGHPASESAMMSAVAQQPVSVAIEADRRAFQSYRNGVLSASAGCGTQLDHGVLAVGYGKAPGSRWHRAMDYWKIKNSWGPSWGEHGYIRVQRGNGGAGTCGLLSQPVYPEMASSVVV